MKKSDIRNVIKISTTHIKTLSRFFLLTLFFLTPFVFLTISACWLFIGWPVPLAISIQHHSVGQIIVLLRIHFSTSAVLLFSLRSSLCVLSDKWKHPFVCSHLKDVLWSFQTAALLISEHLTLSTSCQFSGKYVYMEPLFIIIKIITLFAFDDIPYRMP